jgi:phosphate-selective porin OprO/OprP
MTAAIARLTMLFGVVLASGAAWAAEAGLTPREEMLLDEVRQLKERVVELEKKVQAQPAPTPAPASTMPTTPAQVSAPADAAKSGDYGARLEKIEKKIDEQSKTSATDLKASWKDGLRLETADKNFKLQIGGRIQADWAFFNSSRELRDALGKEDDAAEFRRVRLDLRGTIYEDVYYRLETEFTGDGDDEGRVKFTDVYVGMHDIPVVGSIQVGHFREPIGIERLTNANYTTFMELGLSDSMNPVRNMGVMAYNTLFDQRLLWMVGAFKETDDWPSDDDSDEDQGYSITARLAGLPYYADEGSKLLELGVAYSHRNPDGATVRYRARPEAHLAMNYLDTERYAGFRLADGVADNVDLSQAESVFIYGPFSLQGEYMLSNVDTLYAGTREFSGYYVQASYFLTGEHRVYERDTGVIGRMKPKNNFALGKGAGAWELALRYSGLDLDDGLIRGGNETDYTFGVNWYMNPNTKLMLNYVHAEIDHDLYEGNVNTLQARFQLDF